MGKRSRDLDVNGEELPRQIEVPLWLVAFVASVGAAVVLLWKFNGPARDLEAIFGVPIDLTPYLAQLNMVILVLSVLMGLKVRGVCRRWILRQVENA